MADENGERITGTVKWFDDGKGYGFITPDFAKEGEKDVFVHYSNINGRGRKTLQEDDRVEFQIGQGPKGQTAINVSTI